jgi:hypothetical protein
MRHPRDYTVNEAWIVFRLNDAPIRTEQDGDFHVVCLMDAASCFVLGNEFFATGTTEVPALVAEGLIETGRAAANVLPRKLLLSSALGTEQFARQAERLGIEVERVPDKELTAFLSEVRKGFREQIARRP